MTIAELLTDESKWTRRCYARGKWGEGRLPYDDEAVAWCLIGAARKCYGYDTDEYVDVIGCLRDAISKLGFRFTMILDFNDAFETTFEQVRRVIEEANV